MSSLVTEKLSGLQSRANAVTLEIHHTIKASSCQGKYTCVSMVYMEIALLPKDSLRIKGKHATLVVDPQDKTAYNAGLLIRLSPEQVTPIENSVIISGPGEYEVGGIKMTGLRSEGDVTYSMIVDGVDVLVGRIGTIEKLQQKLKEYHIVIAYEDTVRDASFITGIATNVVIFYGEKGREIANSFGKENVKEMQKYMTTVDKLPAEVETIILV